MSPVFTEDAFTFTFSVLVVSIPWREMFRAIGKLNFRTCKCLNYGLQINDKK